MSSGIQTVQRGYSVFIPNLDCIIRKKGLPDVYGKAGTGSERPERCSIVKLRYESVHTTVRADSGATRGHADEFVTSNRILLAASTQAAIDDQLEVSGYKIRIKILHPRINVIGKVDHYEVEGEVWA